MTTNYQAQSNEKLPHQLIQSFKDLVETAFSDDLHYNRADWELSKACVDEHWDDLLDILRAEITDRTLDFLKQAEVEREAEEDLREPHPSLSAAERNAGLL